MPVQVMTNSQWTHVGVIYIDQENDDKMRFIEIMGAGFYNFEIDNHSEWFLNKNKNHYIGHRALNEKLNDEQLEKFKEGVNALKSKEYDASISAIGAGCDCGDCCGGCCIKICNDKSNKQGRLEKIFCSELAAELLQRAAIMKTNIESDEYTPGDFDENREKKWINKSFMYSDITYYWNGGINNEES
eukprot:UN04438